MGEQEQHDLENDTGVAKPVPTAMRVTLDVLRRPRQELRSIDAEERHERGAQDDLGDRPEPQLEPEEDDRADEAGDRGGEPEEVDEDSQQVRVGDVGDPSERQHRDPPRSG
jgi:hypothetical protein